MFVAKATVAQCVVRIDNPSASLRTVAGRSGLAWLLREFMRFGVTDFLLLTDAAPADLQASLPRPVRVTVSAPPGDSGSGGALFHVRDLLQDRFLLCGGGLPFDWNCGGLLSAAATDETTMIGRIVQGDANIALLRKAVVDHLRPACCLETDVLPDLIRRGVVRSGGLANRLRPADIAVRLRRRALFLDRDGVLNIDHGYVASRDRFEWVGGALDAIRYATEAGWHVFVVTNQSGVGRGLYTEDAVRALLAWVADRAREAGGTIDDVRYCPFHPLAVMDAYRQDHPWRKPRPGMLLDLIRAWDLDPGRAVMVGDQETDMQAAAAAGVTGYLFPGGDLLAFLRPILTQPA